MGRDEDGKREHQRATSRREPMSRGDRFVCEVCGAEFDDEGALRDHVFSQGQVY